MESPWGTAKNPQGTGAEGFSRPKNRSIVLISLKTAFGGIPIKPPALLEVIGSSVIKAITG